MVYLDAKPRNADWIKVVGRGRAFAAWTRAAIDEECRAAYGDYAKAVRARHIAFFAARPELRSSQHPFAAVDRVAAFPPGWSHLAGVIPEGEWHRHHLSGGSSQVLAVALLGAAVHDDPTLAWVPGRNSLGERVAPLFEVELAPPVLNEQPRQTVLDFAVVGSDGVAIAEAKFTERGFGTCSCRHAARGECSKRVLQRPYWHYAKELGLPAAGDGRCALSLAYQPIRNIAAVGAIAEQRRPSFLLLYDRRNPYFTGAGRWPGWVRILEGLSRHASVSFAALAWQELLARVTLDADVLEWVREKHGIETATGQRIAPRSP